MNAKAILPTILRRRADRLFRVAEEVFGSDPREPSRSHIPVVCRCLIAVELMKDGWSSSMVGDVLGRDHATMFYYRGKYNDYLTLPGYEMEREMIQQFGEALANKSK